MTQEAGVRRFASERVRVDVVGTQSYQDAVLREVGAPTVGPDSRAHWHGEAMLEPEPENEHDPGAVRVVVGGETVGYLAARLQPALLQLVRRGERVVVPAYARGGFVFRRGEQAGERASVGLGLRFDPRDILRAAGAAAADPDDAAGSATVAARAA